MLWYFRSHKKIHLFQGIQQVLVNWILCSPPLPPPPAAPGRGPSLRLCLSTMIIEPNATPRCGLPSEYTEHQGKKTHSRLHLKLRRYRMN